MTIINLILILAIIGLILWAVQELPMPALWKKLMTVVIAIFVLLWLMNITGIVNWGPMVPRVR